MAEESHKQEDFVQMIHIESSSLIETPEVRLHNDQTNEKEQDHF